MSGCSMGSNSPVLFLFLSPKELWDCQKSPAASWWLLNVSSTSQSPISYCLLAIVMSTSPSTESQSPQLLPVLYYYHVLSYYGRFLCCWLSHLQKHSFHVLHCDIYSTFCSLHDSLHMHRFFAHSFEPAWNHLPRFFVWGRVGRPQGSSKVLQHCHHEAPEIQQQYIAVWCSLATIQIICSKNSICHWPCTHGSHPTSSLDMNEQNKICYKLSNELECRTFTYGMTYNEGTTHIYIHHRGRSLSSVGLLRVVPIT